MIKWKLVQETVLKELLKIKVEDPALITAAITRESAEELELAIGDEVKAIIKSTEVMVAK